MKAFATALFLLATSLVNKDLGVLVADGRNAIYVSVLNNGDRTAALDGDIRLSSLDGNLKLEVTKQGKKYPLLMEGDPGPRTNERISLRPGHLHGVAIPKRYVRKIYRLSPGCYSITATYWPRNDADPIKSEASQICF